jgi:hypothetical protein
MQWHQRSARLDYLGGSENGAAGTNVSNGVLRILTGPVVLAVAALPMDLMTRCRSVIMGIRVLRGERRAQAQQGHHEGGQQH